MGAQAGIWHRDASPIIPEALLSLDRTLEPYGPDIKNIVARGSVAVLYRAIQVTADSRATPQPHWSKKGALITWNGHLDNRDHLALDLGTRPAAKTDIEVISEAFDRWGTDCFRRFVGDWAVSIWNPQDNELLLARDYIGVKQMFYFASTGRVIWSSDLAALALCGQSFTLCAEYAAGYLALCPSEHRTPYEEILAVRPGTFVRISPQAITQCAYWQFDPDARTTCSSDAGYEEQYRYLFGEAVRRRLQSDCPVLSELSGGFDSSAVTCMADHILEQTGAATPRVDTLTFSDPSEPNEEDSQYSRLVEAKRGRTGHRVVVQNCGDALSFVATDFRATPELPRHEIAQALPTILRAGGYRVVLSGFGGDEVNGQALDFRVLIAESLRARKLRPVAKQAFAWSLETGIPLVQILWQSARILLPSRLRVSKASFKAYVPWLNPDFSTKYGVLAQHLTASEGPRKWGPWICDSFQTLNSLRRQLTSRAPSVAEKRYPFLDVDLARFLLSIPQDQLLRPGERRRLMRRALRDILPQEVVERKTKDGAARSIALTLSKHWGVIEEAVASPLTAELGITDAANFRSSLIATRHGKIPDQIASLLRSLALELWIRSSMARGVIRSSPLEFEALETAVMPIPA